MLSLSLLLRRVSGTRRSGGALAFCGRDPPRHGPRDVTYKKGQPMRIALSVVATLLGISVSAACAASSSDPSTEEQKTFYALGLAVSQSVSGFNLTESELEFVKAGITDGVLKRPKKVEMQ